MKVEQLEQYEVIKKKEVPDLNSRGVLLKHKKSGARVFILENDDSNKVFAIGFRTPPVDSTGTPHILEHSVLCGSEKFPVKDPFIELAKGSLNTFLNAMTYPDKTLYPVASVNDKDFQNLIDVYMDAVLHPDIYRHPEIFRQEGWHYELEDTEGDITINGVVYNEMKGAFSSPDDALSRYVFESLYPDTQYAFESGGDPEVIPELTEERFLKLHQMYYHPSNSYIYLYGNCDMAGKLEWLDREYLSKYEAEEIDSALKTQEPFKEVRTVYKEYPIAESEEEKENTYLSANFCVGTSLDEKLYVGFQVLQYALLDVPGAPLMQALLDRGIGKDIDSIYENGIKQPFFSIIAKNSEEERLPEFLSTIREVLEEQVKNGIDKKALRASLNIFEFRYREADFGNYPKGLMYGLQCFDSWLYDEKNPFMHIEENATFAWLKEAVDKGWFEEILKTWILDNTHASILVMKPVRGLTAAKDKAVAEKLAEMKKSLSEEELKKLAEDTKHLREYQEEPSSEEALKTIPTLEIKDIEKKAEPYTNEEHHLGDTTFLFHDVFTNGIAYLTLLLETDSVPGELVPYLGMLRSFLGQFDTEHYTYADLNNEINFRSGGLSFSVTTYADLKKDNSFRSFLEIRGKYLESQVDFAWKIIPEILFTSKFEDKKRLREVLEMLKSRLSDSLVSSGHMSAVMRSASSFSDAARYMEMLNGIEFYDCVSDYAKNFDEKADQLIAKLREVLSLVLVKNKLMVDFTGGRDTFDTLYAGVRKFKEELDGKALPPAGRIPLTVKNEGIKTASQVQYVASTADYRAAGLSYTGALKVLKVIMGYDYLWQNVRVKGGAYGCMSAFARNGDSYMVSYRDPHIRETLEVFKGAEAYIASFDASKRDMTRYIIGTVSDLDTPLTPRTRGLRSLAAWLGNYTYEDLQKERDEVLGADVAAIRLLAPFARVIMEKNNHCAIGGEERIEENKDLFDTVRSLS
ncbi:MAG: insulinase family protein [Lachnospiraceae bacterium]|nr:insulinase family protein [Lachnospiraceae bacterium]